MRITTQVRLGGDPTALLETIRRFNAACNALSRIAFEERIFHWLPLQRRAYHWLRAEFGLRGDEATVAVRKVAYAYSDKRRRSTLAAFRPLGAVPVCRHAYKRDGTVRLYGHRVPFVARPGVILSSKHEAKLVYRDGRLYLYQVIDIPEPPPFDPKGWLGCDLGIVNILTDSDGARYSGATLNGLRRRHAKLRGRLQAKGTKSAKRLLKRRRQKEQRFARDVNHCISKKVVTKAHDTRRGIALEELGGIRERIKVRRAQRRQHHSWAFFQLRAFVEYKARLAGVPVLAVDPRNTSRECPACGHIAKANRPSQAVFRCVSCGNAGHADAIAAGIIARRALGNAPDAAASASRKSV